MKITILGCGSSMGTPVAGGYWGNCNPENPKNHRTRASIFVQSETTNVLIDTTVDARTQLNSIAPVEKIDGLLWSHCHSDHINGMDDLRAISYFSGNPIETYSNAVTMDDLTTRFPYVFRDGYEGVYRQFIRPNVIEDYGHLTIGDLDIECFPQKHANIDSLGFRFGKFAYSVDVVDFEPEALEKLKGLDVWVVDAAGFKMDTPVTHATIERVRKWVDYLKPKMTYLTVLTYSMDYDALCEELPDHIRPAYDGMAIEV